MKQENSKTISYTIFQLEPSENGTRTMFLSRESVLRLGFAFPPDIHLYREVYSDTQERFDPEEIYQKFNCRHPKDYRGRSLSVSDIIRYTLPNGKNLHLYCDDFGFVGIDTDENRKVAKEPEYSPGSDILSATVTLSYLNNGEMRYLTINAMDLFAGKNSGIDENGATIELTVAEVYDAMRCCYYNWNEQTVKSVCGDEIYFHDMFMKVTTK